MSCPDEITVVLLNIIRFGILNARAAAWGQDTKRCEYETDHIHNLPDLLIEYSRDKLDYYWDVERSCYLDGLNRTSNESLLMFIGLWERLRQAVPDLKSDEEIVLKRDANRAWYEEYLKSKNK